jgi:hypothetical protein
MYALLARAWRAIIKHGHGQSGHGGEPTVDSTLTKVLNKLRGNGHWTSAYLPLPENLGGEAGMGVLTGVELGSSATLGIEADKWLVEEEVPRAWFSSCTRTARACGTRRSTPAT